MLKLSCSHRVDDLGDRARLGAAGAISTLDEHETVRGQATIGADKGSDTHDFIVECRSMKRRPEFAGAR